MRDTDMFYSPRNRRLLHMENQLLKMEMSYLRADEADWNRTAKNTTLSRKRVEELQSAERVLIELLRRMGKPPFGWFLQMHSEFRKIEQKYVKEGKKGK